MKATKAPDMFDYKLRALRVLRGEICIFFLVAAQPRCELVMFGNRA